MSSTTLLQLYQRTSKHSNYQVLSPMLAPLLEGRQIAVKSRHEQERLAYILSRLPVRGLQVADIGGNTGFFSFEMLAAGAERVRYYEGNAAHHDFVQAAAQHLGLGDRLRTHLGYVSFDACDLAPADCTVLLNVLHHLGDDFGRRDAGKEAARQQMLACLHALSHSSRMLVFQLGFNWKGDRHLPLFDEGTKAQMIRFIEQGTAADWEVCAIGIAERDGANMVYRDMSDRNIARDDTLGEFLNRPLFIMKSRRVG
jgi:hypothetical protein